MGARVMPSLDFSRNAIRFSPHKILQHSRFPTQNITTATEGDIASMMPSDKNLDIMAYFNKFYTSAHSALFFFIQTAKKSQRPPKLVNCYNKLYANQFQ
jgi:hypothetical protein